MKRERPTAAGFAACGVALAAALYLAQAATEPGWGDAADLLTRAFDGDLGPFGRSYAIQTVIIRAFGLFLPPAVAASTASAISGALGVGVVVWACLALLRVRPAAAMAAGAALGLSHTYWTSAVEGEVYALLATLSAGAIAAALSVRTHRFGAVCTGAAIALAATHHRAFIPLAPAIAAWAVLSVPSDARRRVTVQMFGGVILGAIPLALLLAAHVLRHPDAPLFDLLSRVLVGAPRNADLLFDSNRPLADSAGYVAKWMVFNLPGAALLAAAVGMVAVHRAGGRLAVVGVVVAILCGLVLPLRFDAVGDRYAFLVPVYPICAYLAALGIESIGRRMPTWGIVVSIACVLAPPTLYVGVGLSTAATRALPELSPAAARDFFVPERRSRSGSLVWAKEALRRVPENGTIYAEWGAGGALDCARRVYGVRTDVRIKRVRPVSVAPTVPGAPAVIFAVTPIWRDDTGRLDGVAGRAEAMGSSVFRLHPPQ